MTAELKRLGKPGAYRLGRLRPQGVAQPRPPVPFRPRFARPLHRWPLAVWLLALLAGVAVIAATAVAFGWWFVPFLAGLGAGVANRVGGWPARAAGWPTRIALPAVAVMGAAGWGLPLLAGALRGEPYGAVARVAAFLTRMPASAVAGLIATVLVAVLQAIAGYWLGTALTPRLPGEHGRALG